MSQEIGVRRESDSRRDGKERSPETGRTSNREGTSNSERNGMQTRSIETSSDASVEGRVPPGAGPAAADALAERYARDGYLAPFRVLEAEEAEGCWERMQALREERPEDAATAFSFNPHYLLPWLYDLARHPRILDKVERVLGLGARIVVT